MANDKKQTAAIAPRPSPAAPEITDSRTGEVVAMAVVDPIDQLAGQLLNSDALMKSLDETAKAKDADFGALEKDFWKPGAVGTPDAVLKGVYLGSAKVGRLIQHAVAQKGKDGKAFAVRLNGGHSLTSQLKQVSPGQGVRIEYKGETATLGLANPEGKGNKMGQWVVTKLG